MKILVTLAALVVLAVPAFAVTQAEANAARTAAQSSKASSDNYHSGHEADNTAGHASYTALANYLNSHMLNAADQAAAVAVLNSASMALGTSDNKLAQTTTLRNNNLGNAGARWNASTQCYMMADWDGAKSHAEAAGNIWDECSSIDCDGGTSANAAQADCDAELARLITIYGN